MNNLYNNVTDKNNFYNKLTAVSALLTSLIYILSVMLIPIISGIINTKNNAYVSATKQYNALANKVLVTKTNNVVFNTINTVTYINNGQMLTRQIDNANLQSYISDAKDSVLKLNSADKSQNQTYSYAAYGKPIANATKSNSVLNVLNPFQYNGERFDNNTNLQYLRARFYNPETKRFINQDNYELLNKFNYVDGNPVMGTDPTGHCKKGIVRSSRRSIQSENFGTEMTRIYRTGSLGILPHDVLNYTMSFLVPKDLRQLKGTSSTLNCRASVALLTQEICPICNNYLHNDEDELYVLECNHQLHERCFKTTELYHKIERNCYFDQRSFTYVYSEETCPYPLCPGAIRRLLVAQKFTFYIDPDFVRVIPDATIASYNEMNANSSAQVTGRPAWKNVTREEFARRVVEMFSSSTGGDHFTNPSYIFISSKIKYRNWIRNFRKMLGGEGFDVPEQYITLVPKNIE